MTRAVFSKVRGLLLFDDSVLSDTEIITRFGAGTLIDALHPHADLPHPLRNRLIALHNSGQIDLLSLTTTQGLANLSGPIFFSVQMVFCDVIPDLDTQVSTMVGAVRRLVEKGGRDYAAHHPYVAFGKWLGKDLSRARAIVAAADAGEDIDKPSIVTALQVIGDSALALRMIHQYKDGRRLAGLTALSRIKPSSETEAKGSIDILLPFCGGQFDDETRSHALNSAFEVLKGFDSLHRVVVPLLVTAVVDTPTDFTRFELIRALWLHHPLFDTKNVRAALDVVRGGDFSQKGLVDTLDAGLHQLLATVHRDLALDFLTELLAIDDGLLSLQNLKSVMQALASGSRDQLFALAVRWFRTGKKRLCESVAEILTHRHGRSPFDSSMKGLGLSGGEQVVVCHRAISYLLLHADISASIVVAALRAGNADVEQDLIDLLVFPILINFQGAARDYLRSIGKGDSAYRAVRKALKRNDTYLKEARIKAPIKELLPSDYQRNVVAMKNKDQGREIRKMAEQKSIFFNLAHRSTLLYGRKARTYVGGPDKPPVTMELKAMSFGFDMPRLDTIDPVGLDHMIRLFRSSKPK